VGGQRGRYTILEAALDACNALTGVRFRIKGRVGEALPEGVVVEATQEPRERVRFAALERKAVRAQELGALAGRAGGLPYPLLLAVPHVDAQTAERARELGVGFVDQAGNAHLRGPGLFVFVTGRRAPRRARRRARTPRAFTPGGLRVVFGVLVRPALLGEPFRDIAAATGVALGTVAGVIEDLAERGYVIEEGNGERRLLARQRLAEEWALLYPVRLRPKLVTGRYRAPGPTWWEKAQLPVGRAVWGGEVAADRLTGQLKPAQHTLYVWGEPGEIIVAHRLRPDDRGDVEILEAFWEPGHAGEVAPKGDVAPPLLVYADLMATGDPRNVEVARIVRKEHLGDVLGPA
jgi:hypothetical protein